MLPEAVLFLQRNAVEFLSLNPDTLQKHEFFPDIQLPPDTSSLSSDAEVRNTKVLHDLQKIRK